MPKNTMSKNNRNEAHASPTIVKTRNAIKLGEKSRVEENRTKESAVKASARLPSSMVCDHGKGTKMAQPLR